MYVFAIVLQYVFECVECVLCEKRLILALESRTMSQLMSSFEYKGLHYFH